MTRFGNSFSSIGGSIKSSWQETIDKAIEKILKPFGHTIRVISNISSVLSNVLQRIHNKVMGIFNKFPEYQDISSKKIHGKRVSENYNQVASIKITSVTKIFREGSFA